MKEEKKRHGQMSEALSTGLLLTLSGGLQDAYTYYYRGKVFANAQTGNIIILGQKLMSGDFSSALRYLLPVLAFGGGIYVSELIRWHERDRQQLHWRQIVVIMEVLLLFAVGFLPQTMNISANIIVSFVCAMQVETFRKMRGSAFASTMCIGNLRSATEMIFKYRHTKEKSCLEKSMRYYGVILIFGIGAAVGSLLAGYFGAKTIWFSCILLLICFGIMFVKEDLEEV